MSQLGRINLKLWQETVKVNDLSDFWYSLCHLENVFDTRNMLSMEEV